MIIIENIVKFFEVMEQFEMFQWDFFFFFQCFEIFVKEFNIFVENLEYVLRISDLIVIVVKQINFVVLNVFIEVVRVGDVGRGFVVVVEEIRKMVVQMMELVKEIKDFNFKVMNQFEILRDVLVVMDRIKEGIEIFGKDISIIVEISFVFSEIFKEQEEIVNDIKRFNGIVVVFKKFLEMQDRYNKELVFLFRNMVSEYLKESGVND